MSTDLAMFLVVVLGLVAAAAEPFLLVRCFALGKSGSRRTLLYALSVGIFTSFCFGTLACALLVKFFHVGTAFFLVPPLCFGIRSVENSYFCS